MSQEKVKFSFEVTRRALYGTGCVLAGVLLGITTMTMAFADGDQSTQTVLGTDLIMPYDGYMMVDSAAITGTRTIKFELYQASSGGAAIWTEEQAVQLYNGRFSVGLGSQTSLTSTILDAEKLYLAMTIVDSSSGTRTEIPLAGRQAIEPAPFAAWSANSADMQVAGDLSVTGDATVGGAATITGAATLQSTASISGKLTAQGDAEVQGELNVSGSTIRVGSGTALSENGSSQLYISGGQAHSGGVYVGNDFQTNYDTTLGSDSSDTTTISGPATLNSTATLKGATTFQDTTTFKDTMSAGTNKLTFTDTAGTTHDLTGNDDSYPDEGVSLRTQSNPSSGEPIFRVMSSGGSERLRVEHDGETSVENDFRVSGDMTVEGDLNTHTTGSYCIISGASSGSCPSGFTSGSVRFDTEDSNNNDSFSGSTGGVTDGGSNGKIDLRLCCK